MAAEAARQTAKIEVERKEAEEARTAEWERLRLTREQQRLQDQQLAAAATRMHHLQEAIEAKNAELNRLTLKQQGMQAYKPDQPTQEPQMSTMEASILLREQWEKDKALKAEAAACMALIQLQVESPQQQQQQQDFDAQKRHEAAEQAIIVDTRKRNAIVAPATTADPHFDARERNEEDRRTTEPYFDAQQRYNREQGFKSAAEFDALRRNEATSHAGTQGNIPSVTRKRNSLAAATPASPKHARQTGKSTDEKDITDFEDLMNQVLQAKSRLKKRGITGLPQIRGFASKGKMAPPPPFSIEASQSTSHKGHYLSQRQRKRHQKPTRRSERVISNKKAFDKAESRRHRQLGKKRQQTLTEEDEDDQLLEQVIEDVKRLSKEEHEEEEQRQNDQNSQVILPRQYLTRKAMVSQDQTFQSSPIPDAKRKECMSYAAAVKTDHLGRAVLANPYRTTTQIQEEKHSEEQELMDCSIDQYYEEATQDKKRFKASPSRYLPDIRVTVSNAATPATTAPLVFKEKPATNATTHAAASEVAQGATHLAVNGQANLEKAAQPNRPTVPMQGIRKEIGGKGTADLTSKEAQPMELKKEDDEEDAQENKTSKKMTKKKVKLPFRPKAANSNRPTATGNRGRQEIGGKKKPTKGGLLKTAPNRPTAAGQSRGQEIGGTRKVSEQIPRSGAELVHQANGNGKPEAKVAQAPVPPTGPSVAANTSNTDSAVAEGHELHQSCATTRSAGQQQSQIKTDGQRLSGTNTPAKAGLAPTSTTAATTAGLQAKPRKFFKKPRVPAAKPAKGTKVIKKMPAPTVQQPQQVVVSLGQRMIPITYQPTDTPKSEAPMVVSAPDAKKIHISQSPPKQLSRKEKVAPAPDLPGPVEILDIS